MLSIGFFRALAKFKGPRLRVQVNDKIRDEPLVVALAADTPKAGGGIMHLAPGANMTDGQMKISLIHAIGRFNVAIEGTNRARPQSSQRIPPKLIRKCTPHPMIPSLPKVASSTIEGGGERATKVAWTFLTSSLIQ